MKHTIDYLKQTQQILSRIDKRQVKAMIRELWKLKISAHNPRIFVLGVGGSAATASHLVNDLRKICNLEAYAPTDNVAELTARINDESWDSSFVTYLHGSRLTPRDAVFVLSVGGGAIDGSVSQNLVEALVYAKTVGAKVLGVVGRDGGYTSHVADACVVIPPRYANSITPHTEGIASVICHLLISHPDLQDPE